MSNPSTSKNVIFKTLVDDVALPLYPKTSVNQVQIDDTHALSDMLITMCNTIDDNTKKITSVENKSPELPDNVKQLLINLFAGAAYGNEKMTPVFNALCTEWGLTPTDDKLDNSVNILYNLEDPVTFVPSEHKHIDTGIKLFENITDEKFTIMIDFSNGENAYIGGDSEKRTVMHCMKEVEPWPGVAITVHGNSGHAILDTYGTTQVLTKTTASTPFYGRNTKVVICFNGTQMRVVCPTAGKAANATYESLYEDKPDTGWFDVTSMTPAISETIILGAYKEADGTMGRYFDGTINRFKVYSGICPDSVIQEFLNTTVPPLDTPTVTFTTPEYKLDKPKVFVPANSDYIDTGIKLFDDISHLERTICIQGVTGTNLDETARDTYSVIHCMEETDPYPGLNVAAWPDKRYGINVYNTIPACKVSTTRSKTEEFKLILVFKGKTVRAVGGIKNSYGNVSGVMDSGAVDIYGLATTVDKTLLFGAYHKSDNTVGRFWDGTLNRAEVYNESFTDEQIFAWMNDWTYNQ